jgi:hypothetical protein
VAARLGYMPLAGTVPGRELFRREPC